MRRFINKTSIIICVLVVLLAVTAGGMVYVLVNYGSIYYLQSKEEVYNMGSGILYRYRDFCEGENLEFTYDFDNEEYAKLIKRYKIDKKAEEGSEFVRAKNLMNKFAGRLSHAGNYDGPDIMTAMELLKYSLDKPSHGIVCRHKAQILNEMCLALKIYSRKVWIMPNSIYDNECHVVNEVWDSELNKWVMLDITHNQYWVDENGTPLSVLEIRDLMYKQEFCTPIESEKDLKDLEKARDKYFNEIIYYAKNLVYMEYMSEYTVGEVDTIYRLQPYTMRFVNEYENQISREAVESSPMDR